MGEFDKASEAMKALMMKKPYKRAVVFIDRLGWARMAAIPTATWSAGQVAQIGANISNNKFCPALISNELLHMHVSVTNCRTIPQGTTTLTNDLINGQTVSTGNQVHLYLLPNCRIVP